MKVSVLCTAYNHEDYIRDALEGFVSQKTNFDYEVIVHDDASTDRTAEIIAEYASRYPDIIKPIFQKENQYSQHVNLYVQILLPSAKGQYIAMCEGDDYWIDENKLQLQIDFLDQHPEYSACVHNSYELDMQTRQKTVMYGDTDCNIQTVQVLKDGNSAYYQTASLVFRKDAMADLPAFLQDTFLDYKLAIYLTLKGSVRYLGKIMSVYRFGAANSFTMRNRKDQHAHACHCRYVSGKLKEINEYTNFEYNDLIMELILENDYAALYYDEKYSEMRKPIYRELYQKESLTNKIKMILKQVFAPLYHLYHRIKY